MKKHLRTFLPVFFFATFFLPSAFTEGATCNAFTSGQTPPAGYGAAWNTLTSARELLLSFSCTSAGSPVTYTVGVNNQNHYVYKIGYFYTSSWRPFTMTGTFAQGSTDWLSVHLLALTH